MLFCEAKCVIWLCCRLLRLRTRRFRWIHLSCSWSYHCSGLLVVEQKCLCFSCRWVGLPQQF